VIQDDDASLAERLTQGQALRYFFRVLDEAQPQRGLLLLCLGGALLNAGVEVSMPRLMASGIDTFMLNQGPTSPPSAVSTSPPSTSSTSRVSTASTSPVSTSPTSTSPASTASASTALSGTPHRLGWIQPLVGPDKLFNDPLVCLGWLYLVAVLLSALLTFAVGYGFNHLGQRVVQRLRDRLFAHLHQLPLTYFDGNPVGRLVTRVANDTGTISEFFTGILANLLCDLVKLAVLLLALVLSSPKLTLSLLVLAPPALAASLAFQRVNARVNRDLRRLLAQLNAFIQENLQGLSTIKAFTAEASMLDKFDQQNGEYLRVEMQLLHLYMLFRPLFGAISMVATAIVLGVGGAQVAAGNLSLGTLVLFLFYLKMLFAPLDDLAERFSVLLSAAVAAERIYKILDTPSEPGLRAGPPPVRVRGAVQFQEVHFAYDPAKPVLQGVSFSLEPGHKLALVGATGSGKSTMISLLQRIYALEEGGSGQILLDGVDIREWPVEALRRQFGVIQQDLFLFRASLNQNIKLFRDITPSSLEEALRVSRAQQVVEAHPEGLERLLGERGHQLSQGERQLVSFARALVGDPPILILDEATASIDSHTEQAIQEALHDLLQGRTAILVAHRLSTIQECDQILVLEQGQVIERGNHRELMEQNGAYAHLVRQQLETV